MIPPRCPPPRHCFLNPGPPSPCGTAARGTPDTPQRPPGHAPASPAEAWGLELGTAEPDVGEGQVDQTGQGQLKVTGIKAEAQLWWTTPALGTAPPAPTVSVGIRGHGVSKMAVASTVEPHHTPSGPAQATYTGPTSCHDEAREGSGPWELWEVPTRARGLRDTPHSAGPRAGGRAQPCLGARGRSRRPPLPRGCFLTPPRGDHRQAAWPGDSPKEEACGRRSYKVLLEGVEGHDPGPGAEPGASLGSPERPAAPAREPGARPRSSAHTGRLAGSGAGAPTGVASWGPQLRPFLRSESGPSWDQEGEGPRLHAQSEGRRGRPPRPRPSV